MKFDVVVGNPPYLNNLHLKFLEIAYNISKQYVVFIQPGGFLLDKKGNKRFKEIRELIKDNLKEITFLNANPIFNVKVAVPFSITFIDKINNEENIKINSKLDNRQYYLHDLKKINKWNNLEIYPGLEEKILNYANKDNFLNHKNEKIGDYYIDLPKVIGNLETTNEKYMTKNDFYVFFRNKNLVCNGKKSTEFFISFTAREEAENCFNYMKTKIARFTLSIYKLNSNLDRGELKSVPWLDFTQEWTDEKLKLYFNLTNEEYNFIQTVIPDYYDEDLKTI